METPMADKDSISSAFTSEEWIVLRDVAPLVSLAVASAGASGLFGTLKEAFSSSASLVEATKSENALLRALCSREEVAAAQKALRASLGDIQASDFEATRDKIAARAEDQLRTAKGILTRKGRPGDAQAFAAFVKGLAERVANAAKEGGFLGFGGERVSEGERQILARLDAALGTRA
jgi:hypothetical protein